jgi:hypothetical protein
MAARSRPRGGQLKDEFDEERSLWNQIRADARRIDQLMVRIFLLYQHSYRHGVQVHENRGTARHGCPSSVFGQEEAASSSKEEGKPTTPQNQMYEWK